MRARARRERTVGWALNVSLLLIVGSFAYAVAMLIAHWALS